MSKICKHGDAARSCAFCEIEELQAQLATLRAEKAAAEQREKDAIKTASDHFERRVQAELRADKADDYVKRAGEALVNARSSTLSEVVTLVEEIHVWNDGPQSFIDGGEDFRKQLLQQLSHLQTGEDRS